MSEAAATQHDTSDRHYTSDDLATFRRHTPSAPGFPMAVNAVLGHPSPP